MVPGIKEPKLLAGGHVPGTAILYDALAEREEQQRIKNLVLNYDLRDDNDTDGDFPFQYPLSANPNRNRAETRKGLDKTHNPYAQPRLDKAGSNRSNQRARKLQLSDVNWYGPSPSFPQSRSRIPSTTPDASVSGRRDSVNPPFQSQRRRRAY